MRPRRRITPYLLVAPALALFTFAVLGPIVATGVFSFFDWDGFGPFDPVGIANYVRAATDPIFRASFLHVGIYIALTIVLEVFVGLLLAGLVTARPRGTGFFRVAFFIPVLLPMVVVAVLWELRLQPRLRPAQLGVGVRSGLEGFTRVWLGDPRHRARRGVGGVGLGFRRVLHGHLLRRVQADPQRGGGGGPDRRGERRSRPSGG